MSKDELSLSNLNPQPYLTVQDIEGQRQTVQIASFRQGKGDFPAGKKKDKPDKLATFVSFVGRKKEMWLNPTNLNALALLFDPTLESPSVKHAIGKKIVIGPDMDVDLDSDEGREECLTLRVVGSPDAIPERLEMFNRAWEQGVRKRGALAKRLKRAIKSIQARSKGGA